VFWIAAYLKLNRYDVIALQADRQGPLDRFNRNHQAFLAMAIDQDALDTVEAPSADSNSLTNSWKSM
jgi:hypothetical protein